MPLLAGAKLEGFAELSKSLKAAGADLDKEFREELKNSSVMYGIVRDARSRLESTYVSGSRSRGKAAAGMRVGATTRAVYVTVSKSKVPYYGWLDFGGDLKPAGKRKNLQKRDFIKHGRALYPAIEAKRPEIRRVALQAAENATTKAGLHG